MNSALQSDQLAVAIQRLLDVEAIRNLKAKGVRLVDAKEWDAWSSEVLSEDYVLHSDGGPIEGRDKVVASVSRSLAEAVNVHRIHPAEINITGPDTASAIWPMDDYVTGTFGDTPLVIRGHGYYDEDYVRTADGWRIRSCKLVRQRVDTSKGVPE